MHISSDRSVALAPACSAILRPGQHTIFPTQCVLLAQTPGVDIWCAAAAELFHVALKIYESWVANPQCWQVHVPDILPGAGTAKFGQMRMTAGEFVDVYSAPHQAQRFDCVATCFFLDTAHNVLEYLEVISNVLKVPNAFSPVLSCVQYSCGSCCVMGLKLH